VRLWNGILHRRRIGKFIRQGIIKDEVSVLLQGNRLKINATADDGIAWLKQMLDKYEEILKLLQ
jgi:hypothetical protein